MPHGHCYQWDPAILWTSVISDSLIAAAYIAIPFTLIFQIMRKRHDLPFNWIFVCFGLFIVACGFTHVMEIVTVWRPHYAALAIVKAITAAASVPTAIILFRLAPKIVRLPSVQQLVQEQSLRVRAEAASDAKDRLIAILSHELRTPLTPVSGGLEIIEEELRKLQGNGDTGAAYQALEMIRKNIATETVLINDLLDLSESGKGELKVNLTPVDLRDVLAKLLPTFQEEIRRKDVRLDVRIEASKTLVMGASMRLHQILSNLLTNAVKFTPKGGEILLELREAGDRLHLSITDSGRGIDAEALDRIFEPFEQFERRPENARGGLGLGLTIARRLAESHGGRLTVESAGRDRGAKFTLELPVVREQPEPGQPPAQSPSTLDRNKPEILLVDDHADTLRMIAFLLRKSGYQVETAASIEEAEPLLEPRKVLISDIGLPDGNGWDLMSIFKAKGGGLGIAISGFGQEGDVERSRRVGFSDHLIKPIDINALRSALNALQPGGR